MIMSFRAACIVAAMSLAVCTFTSYYMPEQPPLSSTETMLVVGACAGIVTSTGWTWNRLRKRGTE